MKPLVKVASTSPSRRLYPRLKSGQQTYIRKEAQLEEILLRGRLEGRDPGGQNCDGAPSPSGRDRVPALPQDFFGEYEGWVKKLKSQWGGELMDWLNGPVEAGITTFAGLLEALREDIDKRYVIDALRRQRRRAGRRHAPGGAAHRPAAAIYRHPFAVLAGREFQALKRVHTRRASSSSGARR